MRNSKNGKRKMRISARDRFFRGLIALLLVAGLATQGALIAQLAKKNKESARLEAEIDQMRSDAVNYQLVIGSNGDRTAMRDRAINVLGMREPNADEIRVVRLPASYSTDTQLVMNDPAE